MNKLHNLVEYLKTIAVTFFALAVILLGFLAIVQHNVYESTAQSEAENDSIEYYLVGILIEKNKYLEEQHPKDYKINLKLGVLYEIYKKYPEAEAQYKLAIQKAPFGVYKPTYKLACFYVSKNRLDEAQKLMDDISEKPDKLLIKYKAEVYFKLGEKYYSAGDYYTAIEKYQKALFYFERISADSRIEDSKNALASSYVYLAEEYVDELKIPEATSALLTANSFVNAPIVEYKLALLLMKTDPDKAHDYFKAVLKKEPGIINYDVYYNFLISLSQAAASVGNTAEAELFQYEAKKFKEYYQNNILSVDDVEMITASGKMVTHFWSKKCKLNVQFQIKNTSKDNLNSLYVYILFKDEDGTVTDYLTQIINVKTPLKPGELSPLVSIKTFKKMAEYNNPPKNVTAEISVSKIENSYRILLATVPIQSNKK